MAAPLQLPTRRTLLAASAAAGASGLLPSATRAADAAGAIRPFRIDVPETALEELRRRVRATRWPDRETVADQSQGVQLATLQAPVRACPLAP